MENHFFRSYHSVLEATIPHWNKAWMVKQPLSELWDMVAGVVENWFACVGGGGGGGSNPWKEGGGCSKRGSRDRPVQRGLSKH